MPRKVISREAAKRPTQKTTRKRPGLTPVSSHDLEKVQTEYKGTVITYYKNGTINISESKNRK